MKDISILFFLNSFSKVLVLIFTLILIRVLSVEEYAYFISVFTFYNILFQLLCGIIERLYVVETKQFLENFLCNISNLYFFIILLPANYFLFYKGLSYFLLIIILSTSSLFLQLLRIIMQKQERFKTYALLEITRNILWLIVGILIVYDYKQGNFVYILYSHAILSLLIFIIGIKKVPSQIGSISKSFTYLNNKKSLISYSVLAGLFPYIVFIATDKFGSNYDISALGAALRYQAILSLVVLSINTVVLSQIGNVSILKNYVKNLWKKVYLAVTICLLFILCVYFLIPFIDGGKYPDSKNYFLLLSATTILSLFNLPPVSILLKKMQYGKILKSLLVSLTVTATLVFALYYFLGIEALQSIEILLFSMIFAYMINLMINVWQCLRLQYEDIDC